MNTYLIKTHTALYGNTYIITAKNIESCLQLWNDSLITDFAERVISIKKKSWSSFLLQLWQVKKAENRELKAEKL